MCEILLDHGANLHLLLPLLGFTPLHFASFGYNNIVALLLARGANVNVLNEEGCTPLYIAAHEGHKKTVKILLERGGNLNEKDSTFMHLAASKNLVRMIDMLAPFVTPKMINEKDKNGKTAMHLAASVECVRRLVSLGYDIRVENNDNHLPIHIAASLGKTNMVKEFVEMDRGLLDYCVTTINVEGGSGTPLCMAAYFRHLQIVRLLVDLGADVNIQGPNGSPLYIAITRGFTAIAEYLVEKGADVDAVHPTSGLAPLHMAVRHLITMVQVLVKAGANINSTASRRGRTAVHEAVESGDKIRVRAMVQLGADLEVETEEGTPLFMASMLAMKDVVAVLLEGGARVDHDVQGWTPLHGDAYCIHHVDVAQLLLDFEKEQYEKEEVRNEERKMVYSPLDIAMWLQRCSRDY